MRNEVEYKIQIEPAMIAALTQLEGEARQFGIDEDEITRATYHWVMDRLKSSTPPGWLLQELDELSQE